MNSHKRLAHLLLRSALAIAVCAATRATQPSKPTPDIQAALDRISAESLRGHLSFLASDLLEGRATPSRGLDIAAEYIAAQFRRIGLKPVGDDGYFQTAEYLFSGPNLRHFRLAINDVPVRNDEVNIDTAAAVSLSSVPVIKVDSRSAFEQLKPEEVHGKAILVDTSAMERRRRLNPAVFLIIDQDNMWARAAQTGRLRAPRAPPRSYPPRVFIRDAGIIKLYEALKPGPTDATASLHISPPVEKPVKLRNVAGLLPGSDPKLSETCVLLTAHYDHLGMLPSGNGDRIFNGANDDGSGTVSVIEIASVLATLKEKPKRSILFLTFFGEEKGLLGSRYYASHPIFPIEKTVAEINLEQVGRTDSAEGPRVSSASVTGFDYSTVGETLSAAGDLTAVKVGGTTNDSESYFARSDNLSLANAGVPAHTLVVAYDFPDYHRVGDEWQKIDYDNMAKIDRMAALGLIMLAGDPQPPAWKESNTKTERYVKAWKQRHAR